MTSDVRLRSRPRPVRAGLVVALSTVLLAALAIAGPSWLRASAAVLWVLVVPGLPWAERMKLGDRGDTIAVAAAISLALAAVIVLLGVSLCALLPVSPGRPPQNHDRRRYDG
ncbi:MAG TPA: hypothetical protein VFG15_23390 [Amycolatopsis sp.]|nr:hypothetical protein [Amycolatopsis sp.]